MVMYLNTGQPVNLNTQQMDAILFSYILVQYLNGRSSTLDKAHKLTIRKPYHLKSELQMFWVFKWLVFRSPLYTEPLVTFLPILAILAIWLKVKEINKALFALKANEANIHIFLYMN